MKHNLLRTAAALLLVMPATALAACSGDTDPSVVPDRPTDTTQSVQTTTPAGLPDAAATKVLVATAQGVDREARTLAAFDLGNPRDYVDSVLADAAAAGVTAAKSPSFPDTGKVTISQGSASVCLTVGSTSDATGTVTPGSCE